MHMRRSVDISVKDDILDYVFDSITEIEFRNTMNQLVKDVNIKQFANLTKKQFINQYVKDKPAKISMNWNDENKSHFLQFVIFTESLKFNRFVIGMFYIPFGYDDYIAMQSADEEKHTLIDVLEEQDKVEKPVDKTGSSINTSVKSVKRL